MANSEAIARMFRHLDALGYRRPDSWNNVTGEEIEGAWSASLAAVDPRDLRSAVVAYDASGEKWWPTPGQLIALIPERGPPLLGWARIWDRAMEGAHDHRRGRAKPPGDAWRLADRPDEHDAAMVALVAAGGWKFLCMGNDKDRTFAARKFEHAFTAEMTRTTAARRWLEAQGGARQLTGDAPRKLTDAGVRS